MAKKPSKKSKHLKELEKIIAELDEASKEPIKVSDEEMANMTKQEEEVLKKYMGYAKKNYDPRDMTTTFNVKEDGPTPSELRDIVDKLLNKKP